MRSRRLNAVKLLPQAGAPIPEARVFTAEGMAAHYVQVPSSGGYGYQWVGRSHYLALHDLRLTDGETFADAGNIKPRRDLRGTLTFVPAGGRIWGWSAPRSQRQSFTALHFDHNQMEEDLSQKLTCVPGQFHVYFSNNILRATLEKMQWALSGTLPYDPMYLESLCLLAGLELCIIQQETLAVMARSPGRLARTQEQKVREYVEANLNRDLGLNDLARLVGLSRFYFARAFKKTTQETPYQYLLRRRIDRAEQLLKESDMTVAEVATQVGFKDATRFIRTFRRLKGATPGKYRE